MRIWPGTPAEELERILMAGQEVFERFAKGADLPQEGQRAAALPTRAAARTARS